MLLLKTYTRYHSHGFKFTLYVRNNNTPRLAMYYYSMLLLKTYTRYHSHGFKFTLYVRNNNTQLV